MKMNLLFALLLIGATSPLQAHWYQKWKDLQAAAEIVSQLVSMQKDAPENIKDEAQNPVHF